jgi:hypothetical protein
LWKQVKQRGLYKLAVPPVLRRVPPARVGDMSENADKIRG